MGRNKARKRDRRRQRNVGISSRRELPENDADRDGLEPHLARNPYRRWRVNWTAVGALAAVAAVLVAYLQFRETRREIELKRAHIVIDAVTVGKIMAGKLVDSSQFAPGDVPAFEVVFKNVGDTHALQFVSSIVVGVFDQYPSFTLDYYTESLAKAADDAQCASCTIVANSGSSYHLKSMGRPLTESDVMALNTGAMRLMVYGFGRYRDITDSKRVAIFCESLSPQSNSLAMCPVHNRSN